MHAGDRPTRDVRNAINRLLRRNDYTAGAEVGEMYLGKNILVVRLVRPRVVEGDWRDTDKTIDILDLMDLQEDS